jgi:peptidoglycan/xylan/chitin deacetylase (PgdA/CDA1 family)
VKALPHDEAMHLDLHAAGVTLAAHSVDHPLLTAVPPERVAQEIRGSIEAVAREVGTAPAAFAYPSGAYDPGVVAAVEDAGCRVAFTTVRGTNRLGRCSWLTLRRVNVGGRTRLPLVHAQTLPLAGAVGRWAGPAPDRFR